MNDKRYTVSEMIKRSKVVAPLVALVLVIIMVGGLLYLFRPPDIDKLYGVQNSDPKYAITSTYVSGRLDVKLEIEKQFEVNEGYTTIKISASNGDILIARDASDFDNLDEHLKFVRDKNKIMVLSQEHKKTEIYDTRVDLITDTNGELTEKVYSIWVESWVYSLSTSDEALYDDLDRIAQSFVYIGNNE